MGTKIEFESPSGATVAGYLAEGPSGARGVVVIQEWWGLVPQIEGVCDRLAAAGFTALAPDLYDGRTVPLDEPDEAAKEMMSIQLADAAAELSGAVDELARRTGDGSVGVVGFCMGGGLALVLAAQRPDAVRAVVPCYGVHPWDEGHPDYARMTAATQIHCAGADDFFTPEAAERLRDTLQALGKDVELYVYEGASHAFANETRPEVFDEAAADLLFSRTVEFLRTS